MRAAGTPPVHIAGRGQDGDLQLHRGVVQSRPSPFWHPLSIPNRLRDTGAQGGPNDLSDKPSTKPGQLQSTLSTPHGGAITPTTALPETFVPCKRSIGRFERYWHKMLCSRSWAGRITLSMFH